MRVRSLGLVCLVLAATLGGCVQYKPVDVFVIGLEPAEGSALEQRIRVDLRIQNPNDQPIAANGMQIRLDVNGARLARGVSDTAFTIPRFGEARTSIIATTTLFDLARQLIVLQGTQSFHYVLEGDVYVEGLGRSVSFRNDGEFTPGAAVNRNGGGALQ